MDKDTFFQQNDKRTGIVFIAPPTPAPYGKKQAEKWDKTPSVCLNSFLTEVTGTQYEFFHYSRLNDF